MSEVLLRSFVRTTASGDVEFAYSDPYEWDREIPAEELQHAIPSAAAEGADGEYQADSHLAPRTFVARGKIVSKGAGAGFDDLRQKMDALMGAHPRGAAGKLRRRIMSGSGPGAVALVDRFLECRVSFRSRGPETGILMATWEVGFRAARPVYRDWAAPTPVALNGPTVSGGVTALTPGGTEPAPPVITLPVTGSGTVTVTEGEQGRSITLSVTAGTYVIDCAARTVTKAGAPTLSSIVAGGFFQVAPHATSITLAATGTAAIAGATVAVRRCWAFAS